MCISDSNLLRLIAGELSEPDRLAFETHLAVCTRCQRSLEALQNTWDALGVGASLPVSLDLTRLIVERATPAARNQMPWLRAAAAILLAAGVGISAGIAMPYRPTSAAAAVPTEEVVRSLGLDLLGSDTGLTDTILDSSDPLGPEERQQ